MLYPDNNGSALESVAILMRELKILLIEDSPLLSERIMELLSGMEGIVSMGAVSTEAAAIEAINQQKPDVILLDLRLKEGTGFSVMRQVRHATKQPVIIVITNYSLPQYRREAEALGARFFLDKSQEFDLIPAMLATLQIEQNANEGGVQ
ncbi:MAG: response regulator [Steroidobacter sp.]